MHTADSHTADSHTAEADVFVGKWELNGTSIPDDEPCWRFLLRDAGQEPVVDPSAEAYHLQPEVKERLRAELHMYGKVCTGIVVYCADAPAVIRGPAPVFHLNCPGFGPLCLADRRGEELCMMQLIEQEKEQPELHGVIGDWYSDKFMDVNIQRGEWLCHGTPIPREEPLVGVAAMLSYEHVKFPPGKNTAVMLGNLTRNWFAWLPTQESVRTGRLVYSEGTVSIQE